MKTKVTILVLVIVLLSSCVRLLHTPTKEVGTNVLSVKQYMDNVLEKAPKGSLLVYIDENGEQVEVRKK